MASQNLEPNREDIASTSESSDMIESGSESIYPNPFAFGKQDNPPPSVDFESVMQGAAPSDATSKVFRAGRFIVGESGVVRFEFAVEQFNDGELGLFSLSGLEEIAPTSEAFLQTAAQRTLSQSSLGQNYVLLQRKLQVPLHYAFGK